jgi:hypothetical protein
MPTNQPLKIHESLPAHHDAPNPPALAMTGSAGLAPLLVGISELSRLLSRSVASLERDDARGALPAAVRLGGSKRWRYGDIALWVEMACPSRADFEAARRAGHRPAGGR